MMRTQRFAILWACLLVLCGQSEAFQTVAWNPTPQQICKKSSLSTLKMSSTNIKENQVDLSSGVSMKVEWAKPANPQQPPLIFLHGSFHGGWCWTERFFSYFLDKGYPVAALNWRGTGGTFAGEGVKKVKIEEHVQDLKALLEDFVPNQFGADAKPILISHSFGGLSIMKYLEEYPSKASEWGGAVIMCSVPPSGNGPMTMRFLRRSLRASWKITAGLAMKKVIKEPNLCRDLFFGGTDDKHEVSDEDVTRYMGYFDHDSEATIDLIGLAKQLPSVQTDDNGRALFLSKSAMPPFLVIGATEDFIVDQEGVEETALYFGLDKPVMVDSPHDVMIGRKFENAAGEIHQWVQDVALQGKP